MKSFFIYCFLLLTFSCVAQTTPLSSGTISFGSAATFPYNQVPTGIAATPASGGSCASSYVYTWEQSIEGGPWTQVGTGGNPPSFPSLVGNTLIRRSVSCSGELLYSNTLSLVPVYTSLDYENRNYVRELTVAKKGVISWYQADQLPVGDKFQSTTYLDGLGRTIQTVDKGISSTDGVTWNDVVKHYQYDAAGRALKDFPAFASGNDPGKFKVNASNEQSFFSQDLYGEPNSAPTYSLSETDGSPLNRVKKVTPPGAGWAGAAVSTDIDFNLKADDEVHIWTLDYAAGALPTTTPTAIYNDGTLLKTITKQDGKQVITYTDQNGNLILKKVQLDAVPTDFYNGWICTYNVYDDFGRLCYQLQPEAVKYLSEHSWAFDPDGKVLSGLCFQYRYDLQGRNTWKKAPGAAPLQMVYDKRDRLVFTQDGNQAAKSPAEWTATLYDELDRPTISTLYHTGKTPGDLQSDADKAISTLVSVSTAGEPVENLVVDNRNPLLSRYAAKNTIEFLPGFESKPGGDEFVAEIDANAATPTLLVTTTVQNPISDAELNNATLCTVLTYQFYDNYAFARAKPFDQNVDNTAAYSTSDPNVQALLATQRTTGFATGSLVRVLGTNLFLSATSYYDERGALIQHLEDNIKSGQDVLTTQYHFDGRVLSTHSKHTAVGTGYRDYGVLTKHDYDKVGRLTSIQKKWGAENFRAIVSYAYDELGRVKTKRLDPLYNGIPGKSGLETLAYSYNILGNITGVNKDYALKAASGMDMYDKWKNFFGFYLGYEKTEGVFAKANLSGQVTGLLWTSQGDDVQRKYDYDYDKAGRLTKATFNERTLPSDAWSNARMNFSVGGAGTDGGIKYDLNGNLLSMTHKGFALSASAPVEIDRLDYSYFDFSNQLKKVTDNTPIGQYNGKAGDFKDGSNGNYRDYVYDANGNLVVDYNKDAYTVTASALDDLTPAPATATPAIKYNFLDKPEEITIAGKGTIRYVYDAEGNKLQKVFTASGSTTPVVTSYVNGYVYKGDELQYIGFEEGRIRVMQDVNQQTGLDGITISGNIALLNGKKGVYDYYLRDYQQNVRMILTEETHEGYNTCTMEDGRAAAEETQFGKTGPNNQVGADNEVRATRFKVADIPGQASNTGWNNASIGAQVSRVGNLPGAVKIGPNALLKVMAGDEVSASSRYFYKAAVTNGTGDNLTTAVINSLVGALTGSTVAKSLTQEEASTVSTALTASDNPVHFLTAPDAANATGNTPKAYLTILFFDERFQYVPEGSTFRRVLTANASDVSLALNSVRAPRNGYCYVYLSNESSEPVYFDNFKVEHTHGRIIEEDHYYAYGLKIAAISSSKTGDAREGKLDNQNLYNGKELQEEADLDWYDYGFRSYDPQIGRFPQLDPLTFSYPYLTPYQYASCDPITNVDVDGLEGSSSVLEPVVVTARALPRAFRTNLDLTSIFRYATQYIYLNKANQTTQLYEAGTFGNSRPASNSFSDSYGDWELTETRPISFESSQPYDGPTLSEGTGSVSTAAEKIDPATYFARKEAVERSEGRVINSFPVIGNFLLSGRRVGQGNISGGLKSFGSAGVEAALWNIPLSRFVPASRGLRVFWVGGSEAQIAAARYAETIGGKTLDMTNTGKVLTWLTKKTSYGFTKPLWKLASRSFAKGASGEASVIINFEQAEANSIWFKIEQPILEGRGVPIKYIVQ